MAMVTSARAADTAATATARQSARVPATLPAGRMVSSRLLRGPSAIVEIGRRAARANREAAAPVYFKRVEQIHKVGGSPRSEESRVGKAWFSTCRYWLSPDH